MSFETWKKEVRAFTTLQDAYMEGAAEKEAEMRALAKENRKLREALREITEGKGRYNRDQLIHASNTIEDMKEIATNALLAKEQTSEPAEAKGRAGK